MSPNQWSVARREMRWHESKILVSIEPSAMTYGMAESSLRRFAGARVAAGGPETCVATLTVATAQASAETAGVDEARLSKYMDCGDAPLCGVLTLETGLGPGACAPCGHVLSQERYRNQIYNN